MLLCGHAMILRSRSGVVRLPPEAWRLGARSYESQLRGGVVDLDFSLFEMLRSRSSGGPSGTEEGQLRHERCVRYRPPGSASRDPHPCQCGRRETLKGARNRTRSPSAFCWREFPGHGLSSSPHPWCTCRGVFFWPLPHHAC